MIEGQRAAHEIVDHVAARRVLADDVGLQPVEADDLIRGEAAEIHPVRTGLACVTVRIGSSISSKSETSIDQKTLPQARLSASGDWYFRCSQERKARSAESE